MKTAWVAVSLLLLAEVAQAYDFTFTAPAPGAVLTAGQPAEVTWTTAPGHVYAVDLWLVEATEGYPYQAFVVRNAMPNRGQYDWTIPTTLSAQGRTWETCGHTYYLYLQDANRRYEVYGYSGRFAVECREATPPPPCR
jgi:hypothetical protein